MHARINQCQIWVINRGKHGHFTFLLICPRIHRMTCFLGLREYYPVIFCSWCRYKCLGFTWSCCVVYWWNVSWHCNFEKSCLFSCHADITNVLLMVLMFNIYYSDHPGQGSQAEDIFWKWASIPRPPSWTVCDATQASTRDAPSCKACIDKGPEKRAGKQSQGGRRC